MIQLLLLLQTMAQAPGSGAGSNYSTPGLEEFVAEAAAANRVIPPQLDRYRASLETDIAIIARTGPEEERAQQLEQVASELTWERRGHLEQRVVGYRDRALGLSISALSALKHPWIVPTLYGDRLGFALTPPSGDSRFRMLLAVHPLASDRDQVYDFTGGDTAITMNTPSRTIHLIRVNVEPARLPGPRTLVFRGELLIDAERKHLVRMRGEFLVAQAHRSPLNRLREMALEALLFAELVDGEVEERFWLPTYQRVEIQLRSQMATEVRPVFRLVTHFRNYYLGSDLQLGSPATGNPRTVLSYAPTDSLNAFNHWNREIGAEATRVAASDFDDVAPDQWRSTGKPRFMVGAEHPSEVIRFNRVEGFYLGPAARFDFRDAAPGFTISGRVGWALSEEAIRGGMTARWLSGRWKTRVAIERVLANTNDFTPVLEGDATLSALLGTIDDYDYVDRWEATAGVTGEFGGPHDWRLRLEVGPGRDQSEIARIQHGLFHPDSLFRPNRPAAQGSYFRESAMVEFHPNVSGEFLEPGIGATISYQRGDGQLEWQRLDGKIVGRRTLGPFNLATRIDAAAVFGGAPPQQLIEVGENEGLPGYGYKEFGGDRAALVRAGVTYSFPVLRAPLRLLRWLVLPNLSPAVGVSFQGGWTDASSAAVQATLLSFGYRQDPGSPVGSLIPMTRPTGGFRSTVTFSLGLFGGALGVGLARPLDHPAKWVVVLGTNQQW